MKYLKMKSLAVIGTVVISLFCFGVAYYQYTVSLLETNFWVTHTNEVISQTNKVQANVFESDAIFLRYIVTGEERFNSEYKQQIIETKRQADKLKQLTKDNQIQQTNVVDLLLAYDARLDFQKKITDDPKLAGDPVNNHLRFNVSLMIQEINDEEYKLLRQRLITSERAIITLNYAIGLGTILCMGIAFGGGHFYGEVIRENNMMRFVDKIKDAN